MSIQKVLESYHCWPPPPAREYVRQTVPAHPDTITDIAPDCRGVLRDEYHAIQLALRSFDSAAIADAANRDPHVAHLRRLGETRAANAECRDVMLRLGDERAERVLDAVREYERVAAMWGVELE